jgi:hypothetical protein
VPSKKEKKKKKKKERKKNKRRKKKKRRKKEKKCKDAPTHLLIRNAFINLLKTKRNILYIRNQALPRSKHCPPRL